MFSGLDGQRSGAMPVECGEGHRGQEERHLKQGWIGGKGIVARQGLGVVTVVAGFSRSAHNITRIMYLLDAGRMSLDTPRKLWLRLTLLK
ncbi:hypothetical protein E2C01_102812 [Portunus trituberculatus]|uniref:Uncharacterized protein n=1 Tax=Portunus trituberculatus TaxID=210409 RepID=A0A5B7KE74_PORTR|nr:hypothetical protein [Portunus trituberculatus]